jgi:hypothetical protein
MNSISGARADRNEALIVDEKVTRGYLGVKVQTLTSEQAKKHPLACVLTISLRWVGTER